MEDGYLYKAKTTPKEKGEFNNVWVTGNLIVSNGKYYIHPVNNVVNVKNEIGRIIVMHEVIPDTICRCTGLKDKNGNLIFDNDIVNAITSNRLGGPVRIEDIVVIASDYKLMFGLDYSNELERVGNIFDKEEKENDA